jgi:hypothetical protein
MVPLSKATIKSLQIICGSFGMVIGVDRSEGSSGAATDDGKGWPSASRIAAISCCCR